MSLSVSPHRVFLIAAVVLSVPLVAYVFPSGFLPLYLLLLVVTVLLLRHARRRLSGIESVSITVNRSGAQPPTD